MRDSARIRPKKKVENKFEKLVEEALIALPKRIRDKMDNVAIVIEKRPTGASFWAFIREFLKTFGVVPLNVGGRASNI